MFLFEQPGSQTINQNEKNASLTNAINNELYPIVSKVLNQVTLNHFGKGANDTAVAILFSVMATESRCDPTRNNPGGAKGLMQLTPICVEELIRLGQSISYEDMSVEDNIKGGVMYLNYLSNRILKDKVVKTQWKNGDYLNNISLMMTCYNNGFGSVKKAINNKTFKSNSAKYFNDIKSFYNFWSAGGTLKRVKTEKPAVKTEKPIVGQSTASPTNPAATPTKKEENIYISNHLLIKENTLRNLIYTALIKTHR
jgi:hypothetical protein